MDIHHIAHDLLCPALCASMLVATQAFGDPPVVRPDAPPPATRPYFVLPALETDLPRDDRLSKRVRVEVRRFHFEGNTALSTEEIERIAAPWTGHPISSEELQALRQRLTLLYVERGYVNSGVVIPDQAVEDGIVVLQVLEGRLQEIEVTGLKRLHPDYVRARLALAAEQPLNIRQLAECTLLLQQDPLIHRIQARLEPGERPGAGVLKVQVDESKPFLLAVVLDNHRPPSVGAERLHLEAAHRNLSGRGDTLRADYGFTAGLDDFALSYGLPLNAHDSRLELRYERSDSAVVEAPFEELDIESRTRAWGIALRHPLLKSPDRELALIFNLEHRHNRSTLMGQPFSFSAGSSAGESTVTALRFAQDWSWRTADQVLALRSTFSQGLDAFGATLNDDQPDGRYLSWLGQAQWVRRLQSGRQVLARVDMQLSDAPLLLMEKFAVGGAHSVRGYRENQLTRDNGLVASLELRTTIARAADSARSHWQLAAFFDYGRSWNHDDTALPRDLASIGIGLHWDPERTRHAELYWGKALRQVGSNTHDLQDDGIHFAARWQFH